MFVIHYWLANYRLTQIAACCCTIMTVIKCIYFTEPYSNYWAFFFYRLQRPFNLTVIPLYNAAMLSAVAEVITFLQTKAGRPVPSAISVGNRWGRRWGLQSASVMHWAGSAHGALETEHTHIRNVTFLPQWKEMVFQHQDFCCFQ